MLVQGVHSTMKSHELVLLGLAGTGCQGALQQPENGRQLIERMKSIAPTIVGFGLARPMASWCWSAA